MDEIVKIEIVESGEIDPWYNLALEEYLLKEVREGEVILYLWQNQNTVVIGRNQNPWKECRYQLLEKEGGKIARRLSGGGAVFHDLGNLNFTFILDKKLYNLDKQLQVILTAVRKLGIEAEFSGRNDLVVAGKKFSGNAFYFTEKAAYHHGTILLDTDFSKLVKYLQVSKEKIVSKGIDSVRSRVINLKELNPELTVDKMKDALYSSFLSSYMSESIPESLEPHIFFPSQLIELKKLYNKYSSWLWCFGKSPQFDISYKKRFNWGEMELGFSLKNGRIQEATIYSDAMETVLIGDLIGQFTGIPFKLEEILKSIESAEEEFSPEVYNYSDAKRVFEEIKDWLKDCF